MRKRLAEEIQNNPSLLESLPLVKGNLVHPKPRERKTRPIYMLPTGDPRDIYRLKVKGWEKNVH